MILIMTSLKNVEEIKKEEESPKKKVKDNIMP